MRIEVAFVAPELELLETLELAQDARVADAVAAVAERLAPTYDVARLGVGVFGERVTPERPLSDGERVELYRPLRVTPVERRRRLASKT